MAPPGADGAPVGARPLVLTLLLEQAAQQWFDRLRAAHFPADRNHLAAHVTLFHALPGEHLAAVSADVARAAGRPAFDVAVTGVRSLGGGVAYDLAAPELSELHARLADGWTPWLTRQDAQPLRAHVTVQNKVPADRARALHAELSESFTRTAVGARGLALWRYLGGPWEPVSDHPFTG